MPTYLYNQELLPSIEESTNQEEFTIYMEKKIKKYWNPGIQNLMKNCIYKKRKDNVIEIYFAGEEGNKKAQKVFNENKRLNDYSLRNFNKPRGFDEFTYILFGKEVITYLTFGIIDEQKVKIDNMSLYYHE